MMLMTKFGKFKLRLIANFSIAGLLSIINLFAANSSYWLKYIDTETGETHFAGLWRSCPNQGPCVWKNGIVDSFHSFWAICVRFFILFACTFSVLTVLVYFMAFVYKVNKRTRLVIRLLEWGNLIHVGSLVVMFAGFAIFIANDCNISIWFHTLAMVLVIVTSNMITKTFAELYFASTRLTQATKSCETGMSHAKLGDAEERIALAPMPGQEAVAAITDKCSAKIQMSPVEARKVNETNGSNEALIPSAAVAVAMETAPAVTAPSAPEATN